ncbi:MAG: hypothetical protein L0Y35_03515 [Flammeovirgaceae bacterium]|nr:hypothetical protein [Flammeovirgaceae bacterium]
MKTIIRLLLIGLSLYAFLFVSCASQPKPYYETKLGKQKQKHYNNIQFGGSQHVVKNYGKKKG